MCLTVCVSERLCVFDYNRYYVFKCACNILTTQKPHFVNIFFSSPVFQNVSEVFKRMAPLTFLVLIMSQQRREAIVLSVSTYLDIFLIYVYHSKHFCLATVTRCFVIISAMIVID